MEVQEEVQEALAAGRPVVALESTLISHGLPRPRNLSVAREIEATIRAAGAVPATIAVLGGRVRVGLDGVELEAVASRDDVVKCGVRDLAPVIALGGHGATTVASTARLAAAAGVRVFATGGLGGVHREARDSWDESADLTTLAATPITVVCSGVKSILDIGATLERLESLNVTVLGYGTDRFPGFYLTDSGFGVPWGVDTPADVAAIARAREDLGLEGAIVVGNPLPEAEQLDPVLHDRVLTAALAEAAALGVTGKDATPFLLERFHRETAGESLEANVRIILRNARLAAEIAAAM